eukprot:14171830-Alexandrium_andersonii.AAC.1
MAVLGVRIPGAARRALAFLARASLRRCVAACRVPRRDASCLQWAAEHRLLGIGGIESMSH